GEADGSPPLIPSRRSSDLTRLDLLARYACGGWEKRWTLLGLGEAYARIATGREVRARIVSDSSGSGDVQANVGNAFRRVRPGLRSEEHTSELQSRDKLVCR